MAEEILDNAKVKVVIGKWFELAYAKDKGVTTALIRQKGPFTMKVDDKGNVTLSGKAGKVTFNGNPALKSFGLQTHYGGITFANAGNNTIMYTVSLKFFGFAKVDFTNMIDVEKLITACSGLLCQAARALKNRNKQLDDALEGAFR
jgi:hypothetical protein